VNRKDVAYDLICSNFTEWMMGKMGLNHVMYVGMCSIWQQIQIFCVYAKGFQMFNNII
jgi:hypothetical protein